MIKPVAIASSFLLALSVGPQRLHAQGAQQSQLAQQTQSRQWNGYEQIEFTVEGVRGYVVSPRIPAPGKPWLWQARFPDFHPEPAIALLSKGFHVAYYDLPNIFGNPLAVLQFDRFYEYVTRTFGLAPKVSLEAISRGGLFVYNWAAKNPEKVSSIYGETPVCDMKSWPGGKGKGLGSVPDWKQALASYSFTEAQMMSFKGNPIDELAPLAQYKIPMLHVVGEHDQIAPPAENSLVLAERYRALGGPITLHFNTAGPETLHGHHFPLDDGGALAVNFILSHTPGREQLAGSCLTPQAVDYFALRDGLRNSLLHFSKGGEARVVFLGGSITNMHGWREQVCQYLQTRFPATRFDFINAGIPSTGSTPGAFRLMRDVFSHGPVDLLFEEAAVNDDTNFFRARDSMRGMEGIVRHALSINPLLDIVLMHFVDPGKMQDYRSGKTPTVIEAHEKVAIEYGLPSLNLAREVTERIDAGEFDWLHDFKDLHPSPFGQTVYSRSIVRLLEAAWKESLSVASQPVVHPLPPALDPHSYSHGLLVDIQTVTRGNGWSIDSSWHPADEVVAGKPNEKVGTRPGFVDVPMLIATVPGSESHFNFSGSAVGVFVAAGPDAGMLEYSIDDGPFHRKDLFTKWSPTLHIPWAYVLDADLSNGRHTLVLRAAKQKNPDSKGTAVRIVNMLVNESQ